MRCGRFSRNSAKLTFLVNNAGGMPGSHVIEDMTEEEWDKVQALNIKSDFLFCKYIVPHMKERKYGRIINFSSVGAINPPGSRHPLQHRESRGNRFHL